MFVLLNWPQQLIPHRFSSSRAPGVLTLHTQVQRTQMTLQPKLLLNLLCQQLSLSHCFFEFPSLVVTTKNLVSEGGDAVMKNEIFEAFCTPVDLHCGLAWPKPLAHDSVLHQRNGCGTFFFPGGGAPAEHSCLGDSPSSGTSIPSRPRTCDLPC